MSSLPTFRKKYCICDHNDLAIISTEPISFIYSDSSFIVGETTIQDVPVRVFSVHLPCNINRQKLTDTCHLIVKLASTQVSILAGDFNLDPQRPKDQHFFSIMRGILANANLTWHKNYLNTRFPDHIQHSAHSLDHFFLSIPKSHTSLKIIPSSHSDHATLTLTIAQIAPIKTSCIKHIKSPIEDFDSLLTQRTKDVRDYVQLIRIIYKIDHELTTSFKKLQVKVEAGHPQRSRRTQEFTPCKSLSEAPMAPSFYETLEGLCQRNTNPNHLKSH